MAVLPTGIGPVTGGYQIERSLRFNSADSAYLNRTPGSAGNRKTWTWSGWVKRGVLASNQSLLSVNATTDYTTFRFSSSDILQFYLDVDALNYAVEVPTVVWRDPSAWYHIVLAVDTTQATAGNRVKIYVNSVQQTVSAISGLSIPAQNFDTDVNSTLPHAIGVFNFNSTAYLNGYLTEINFIDGQALTPSSFGETDSATGVWKPKAFSGTYGTNGFYLKFADNSGTTSTTLGKDSSGNGNNWTPNNFSVTAGAGNDSMVDSPTSYGTDTGAGGEVRGNYCALNPLDNAQGATFSNGNLQAANVAGTDKFYRGTFGMSSGKWYWEIQLSTVGNRNNLGITDTGLIYNSTTLAGNYAIVSVGNQDSTTTGTLSGTIPTFSANDYITFALDIAAGTLYFEKNAAPNTSTSPKFTGLSTTSTYFVTNRETGATPGTNIFNFGQRAFAYTAPSGFKALCTQNLPTPTIGATSTTQADDYMNVVLYTGTGSSNAQTGVGFQPDLVWIKGRSGATDHGLYDAVRGVQKQLESNTTTAETTETTGLTAFGTDGFTVGALAQLNTSSATYVAWNWKGNGAGSSNTAGTITSTVSANTTSGFSIVTYTGTGANATVGHGLGVAPSMIIAKLRSSTSNWPVYHRSLDAGKVVWLDLTDGQTTSVSYNGAPTSSIINLGTAGGTNTSSGTHVIYAFAPVAGYSAFGSYTGNGSTDGPFVFLNFRPRYVLVKRTDSTGWWHIWDAARNTSNLSNLVLFPNGSDAESTYTAPDPVIDMLSNGFKHRGNYSHVNASGGTYIYAAFAESPFKYSLAR